MTTLAGLAGPSERRMAPSWGNCGQRLRYCRSNWSELSELSELSEGDSTDALFG